MQKAPHLDVFVIFYEQMTFLGSITDSKWVYLGPPSLLQTERQVHRARGRHFFPASDGDERRRSDMGRPLCSSDRRENVLVLRLRDGGGC